MLDSSTQILQHNPEQTNLQENKRNTNTTLTIYSIKTLLALLHRKHLTQPQIQKHTGLVNSTVSRWLGVLHSKPENLVYIVDWIRTGSRGNYSAVWAAGYCMEDKPKPAALSSSEYNKKWRKKKAKELEVINVKPGVTQYVSS